MIEYKKGNILLESVEALVNTVNCVGIMGRGIALQFKKNYPSNYKAYKNACDQQQIQPGKMFVYQISQLTDPKYIINFPTKRHWRGKSRIEDIKSGLTDLIKIINDLNISSIAIPPLGCGLGGLDWSDVRQEIEAALSSLNNVHVVIFEPNTSITENATNYSHEVPKMTVGRAALIVLIHQYLKGLMDPFVTLLEIHKLMYFMQEAGQPLRLTYQKALYGPYAENLRHVLHYIEGHLITGYADGGDAPDKQIELVPGAIKDAKEFLENNPETISRFNRVTNLVNGFETPFGLELLATVHWVVTKENAYSPEDTINLVYNWNDRKKHFTERQIRIAYETLLDKGWITN